MKIPLTLAIVSALIVEAGGERFAIPQISVVELVRASYQAGETGSVIERIDGTPVLRLRDRLLPLVNLQDLLQLSRASADESCKTAESHCIVVTQVGANTLGIIVDRVFDTEEIVVKPVAPVLRSISMFSGNTILGDGSVIMILDTNGIARATGTAGGEVRATTAKSEADRLALAAGSAARTAMLLFRAGSTEPKAVPLGLVARLEDIPRERIEFSAGQPVIQYRGHLMPLVPMSGSLDIERAQQAVLVFADVDHKLGRERSMGLVVDEIVDVVEDRLRIELTGDRPGLLGTAVIAGHATDVVDIGYWLNQAFGDWFSANREGKRNSARILVVEDSDFFRQLVVPILSAAGYEVMAANDGAQALRLREAGLMFDAIVSDIEMPELDGLEFVRRVRAEGAWAELPVIALTANGSAGAEEAGRTAGFTDYVQKLDRDTLLASLRRHLAPSGAPSGEMRLAA